MNIHLLLHTLLHLTPTQIFYQIRYRISKPGYRLYEWKGENAPLHLKPYIPKPECHTSSGKFVFLNLSNDFSSWNDTSNGMLWAYNLNYMDWLCQEGITLEEGTGWIDKFIEELPTNRVGLDPYPIALRGINWIKFISLHRDEINESKLVTWNDSLYSQYALLTKKLEYHLLGNHLLEDAYSLYMAAIYFRDKVFYKKASCLLRRQLNEQILPDGAHYEQSPMYHCILLDRLLDCCNLSFNNIFFDGQGEFNEYLVHKAEMMLGHLESIVYNDGAIPLLNDSANGIAPSPRQIRDYASELGIRWMATPMKECGYRKINGDRFEAIVDIGGIAASYQPGHSHADTFNYELRIDGCPFIVDTGISTYNKTSRRQLERSTQAHNTVTVAGRNSSEVWGGFRVGDRAKVKVVCDTPGRIEAVHDGFGVHALHRRIFEKPDEGCLKIIDKISSASDCKSYIHFAPDIKILDCGKSEIRTDKAVISINGASAVEVISGKVSDEYNIFHATEIAVLHFSEILEYQIDIL